MNRKSYYSSSSTNRSSYYNYSKRVRSPSPISRSPISPAPKRLRAPPPPPPPPPPAAVSAPSPISSASDITPLGQPEPISDPRKATLTSNFQCQCLRPEEEIIFPGGLPRFVQEGRVEKEISLAIKTHQGLRLETFPLQAREEGRAISDLPEGCREPWIEGCRVLLLQGLPEQLKIGNSWRNFIRFANISGLLRAELLSAEAFGLTAPSGPSGGGTSLDGALLVFCDEISAKTVFLEREISAYGQEISVRPDPHFLRTLQLAAAGIFARLPRRSTPTSPATPADDSAPRFGGGLSRRAKQQPALVPAGARHALRLLPCGASEEETFWRDRGAQSYDRVSQAGIVTVRFPRAPQRDSCLAYVPVPVRILDVAELLISMTESGLVAVVETLSHEQQLFAPLRGELEDVR